ncbi:MAG: MFS transporter [Bacteroidales bacterium]|nr:MFS transporter [Bacteroidales bacterium]
MDKAVRTKYVRWQWRTLIALMLGYICYYFLRKNFSAAIPAMEAELGLSKVQLGIFLTLNGIVYGVSRMINGLLADRYSKRLLMSLGLALSCIINLAICFSPKLNGVFNLLDGEGKATMGLVYLIGSLWVLNGYVHGMGYPPCAALMAHWFRPSELATKQSIWNASHSIGAGVVIALCGWMLGKFGYSAWNLCFIVPAAISIVGAVALYATLRDDPSSIGLPPVEEFEAEGNGSEKASEASAEVQLTGEKYRAFISRMVFRNPVIWGISISDFCVYVIRFTILEWGTTFLTQYKGFDIALSASIVAASELIGGVLGTIVAGWVTDRYLQSKTLRASALFTLGATICFTLFWRVPAGASWIWSAILIVASSFFIYGPQALLGVSCSQYATKRASGSANGFCGIFCYGATVISGIGFGYLADKPEFGWNAVFVVAILFGLIGSAILLSYWKAPADGYAKAEEVMAELR